MSGTVDPGWPISTYAGGLSSGSGLFLPLQGWLLLLNEPSLPLVIPSEVTAVDSEPPLYRFGDGAHCEFVLSEYDEALDELLGPGLIGPWGCNELPGCKGGCKGGGAGGPIGNRSEG